MSVLAVEIFFDVEQRVVEIGMILGILLGSSSPSSVSSLIHLLVDLYELIESLQFLLHFLVERKRVLVFIASIQI